MRADLEIHKGSHHTLHPIVMVYEEKLGGLIGILSKFIVEKKYSESTSGGQKLLDLDSALVMSKGILDEVSLIVGPARTMLLAEEFETITRDYFQEEK